MYKINFVSRDLCTCCRPYARSADLFVCTSCEPYARALDLFVSTRCGPVSLRTLTLTLSHSYMPDFLVRRANSLREENKSK